MASVKYLKGVRTRYRNSLEKEITCCQEILTADLEEVSKQVQLAKINKCVKMLRTYNEKVEKQCEKYIAVLTDRGESEEIDEMEQIMNEDYSLCDQAMECCLELEIYRDHVEAEVKLSTRAQKESTEQDKASALQHQMQSFMIEQTTRHQEFVERQSRYQHDFMERQAIRQQEVMDKVCAPREPPTSMKLPKLELKAFYGDKLQWQEFWDCFECAVHSNSKLSDVEKFSYLKSKLGGESKATISGLALCNESYKIAVSLLQDRYGKKQEIIDLHYHAMMNIAQPSNKTENLRLFLNTIEKHLRSLDVMGENTNQNMFVSMIKSKIPKDVLLHIEVQKGTEHEWSVKELRDRLRAYIIAKERTEQETKSETSKIVDQKQSNQGGFRYENRTSTRKSGNIENRSLISRQRTSTETLVSGDTQINSYANKCRYCANHHWSDECTKFKTITERKRLLKDSCFKCLKVGHKTGECRQNKICVHCGEKNVHHRSLCPQKFNVKVHRNKNEIASVSEVTDEINVDENKNQENVLVSSDEIVLMQTARTEVKNPTYENKSQIRLLLDSGSQRTYVTERLAEQLGLTKGENQEIKLATFGSKKANIIKTPTTKLSIRLNNGEYMTVSANIVPDITGTIERKAVKLTRSNEIQHILGSVDMADTIPNVSEYTTVDLLIGNDFYLDIVLPQRIEIRPGLYLLSSKLGWILTGRLNETASDMNVNMLILTYGTDTNCRLGSSVFTSVDKPIPKKPDLEDFWALESIGITDNPSNCDDEIAMAKFRETLKFSDGRYQAIWPWKEDIPDLPLNRGLAMGRLKSTVTRLKDKPDVLKQYDTVIRDQLNKGVIEKVNGDGANGIKHYLPHHAVITPQKTTTKLRVVYDASAKTSANHKCLNECLYRGPVMIRDLCGILMRFRTHNIGIVADIEKAFLQVGLQPDQRDATRFLWLKNFEIPTTENDNIQEFRFCRIPFGVISSPFILGATIECHLESYQNEITKKLKNDIYVDNVITGANSVEEAINLYRYSKRVFQEAAMNLREWSTNNGIVNSVIPEVDNANAEIIKVLGHSWNTKQDTLSLMQPTLLSESTKPTKRTVLKQLASVFDPLGMFSPIILRGKVLLQVLWSKALEWDDEIEATDVTKWTSIKEDLVKVSEVEIPRCIALKANGEEVRFRLLCFCDASTIAYATVVYLHQEIGNISKADLVFSKSRLAPTKQVTIPRLELMAVVIGSRCVKFVKDHLTLPIDQVYIWSDSQCVLHWIASDNVSSVFVANRVKEIKNSCVTEFRYIPSNENPADLATRGSNVHQLRHHELWWHGPQWLTKPSTEWEVYTNPKSTNCTRAENTISSQRIELSISKSTSTTKANAVFPPLGIDSERYSSASKLLRITAFSLRFINKLRKRSQEHNSLTKRELVDAENIWIRYVQRKCYGDIFDSFSTERPCSLQRQLGLFLDDSGIVRCRGRLENSDLIEGAREPILLPKHERFTHLMILKVHKACLHSGVSQTLSSVRQRFWIPSGRAVVKTVIRKCLECRRYEGGAYKMPDMAPLPKDRVTESAPFNKVGLDYLGPLYVKDAGGVNKIWICLYTCLVTRAVHLELMHNLSTEEFLFGLRRFIANRGAPDVIISDNAPQFKLANKTLALLWRSIFKSNDLQSYVSERGIRWTFIVEFAPWQGGFYERLVGVVKRSLRKAIGRKLLMDVQMQTVIKEVEAVVNTRPLTYVGDDINSMITLTPASFLTLNPNIGFPSLIDEDDKDFTPYESSAEKLLQRWKKGQKLLNAFWQIWRNEYLMSLRERLQTKLKSNRVQSPFEPKVGDIVLIKDDLPRGSWKLGRINSLVVSHDGHVRSAKVSLASRRVIGRPLNLLFPIEVSGNVDPLNHRDAIRHELPNKYQRPVRKAANIARSELKRYFNEIN